MINLQSHLVKLGYLNSGLLPATTPAAAATTIVPYRKLLELSMLRPAAFAEIVAELHGLRRIDLDQLLAGKSLVQGFSQHFLTDTGLYPYRGTDGKVHVATADPSAQSAIEAITLTLGEAFVVEVAAFDEIEIALDRGGEEAERESAAARGADDAGPESEDVDSLRDLASGAPVVKALDDLFDRAVSLRATDIHVEPLRRDFQLRVRVDGVLRHLPVPRGIALRALISRIKIVSALNIAEHRLPQDGRTRVKVRGREFDIRVAIMPTTGGEAAIMRLLDRSSRLVDFDQLGFRARDESVLKRQLAMPHGLVVVTGPTGSGKTTTLAAALATLNDATRKILTIEDPVEYEIPGVNQSQVRPQVGLTFASALRAFLRQDPDVIMVGEVRDTETAKIAIQASLTGHLVMTTLHTNTAAAAVTRLVDVGVESFLIASTLRTVVAQRLVRLLCPDCRRPTIVTSEDHDEDPRLVAIGIETGTTLYEPVGCERCGGTGYRGRRAIFEVLDVTEPVRRLILHGSDDSVIEKEARSEGMTTMIEDGRARCLDGTTSVDEVFRVAALR